MEDENNEIEENIEKNTEIHEDIELEEPIEQTEEIDIEQPTEKEEEVAMEEVPQQELTPEISEDTNIIETPTEVIGEPDSEITESEPSEDGIIELEGSVPQISEEERAMNLEKEFYKNQIEASLFVAGRPLGLEELSVKLELKKDKVKDYIQEIAFEYLDRTTSIEIVQIGDKYSMQIKPEYTERVSKFAAGGLIPERIMRTLTIIALKQPILKSTVVKLRGSGAYEHIKWLLDNDFIGAIKKGRTFELTTAQKFAETFGFSTNIEEMKKQMISQLESK